MPSAPARRTLSLSPSKSSSCRSVYPALLRPSLTTLRIKAASSTNKKKPQMEPLSADNRLSQEQKENLDLIMGVSLEVAVESG